MVVLRHIIHIEYNPMPEKYKKNLILSIKRCMCDTTVTDETNRCICYILGTDVKQ